MTFLDFKSFPYVPALRSRDSEGLAFRSLPENYQNRLLPLVTLFRSGNGTDFGTPLSKATRMVDGRPFILDIDRIQARVSRTADQDVIDAARTFNSTLSALTAPTNGFSAWRDFAAAVPNAVPCAVIGGTVEDFTSQVRAILASKGKVAIRTSGSDTEMEHVLAALTAVPNVAHVLLIVDLGDVRGRVARAAQVFEIARSRVVAALPFDWPALSLVCLGTSFPFETPPAGVTRLDIEEADVFDAVGGFAVAQYGDYVGMPVRPQKGGGMGYPRIVGPMDREWIQCRGQNVGALKEYIPCAVELKKAGWVNIPDLWGSDRIDAAAKGNIANMGNAAKWLAVKMNIHLYRQLDRASALLGVPQPDDDEDELPDDS